MAYPPYKAGVLPLSKSGSGSIQSFTHVIVTANVNNSQFEQKVINLTNERKLLVAGLEAVIQDLQDMQDSTKEKVKKSKKQFLEQLCEQKGLLLEKLSSNLKDLKQAQALAADQPGSINEQKIQEFNEQRRLLSIGLEGIVQNIQNVENLKSSRTELLTPYEIQALSEKRKLYLDNMELNLKDLKLLQAAAVTQPDNEQIIQLLAEKKIILFDNLAEIIQDMEQAQNFDLEKGLTKRSDEREIHELLVFSALESKCYELEEMGTLPYNQLDVIKRKVYNLQERRKSSFDRCHLLYPKEPPIENMLERQKEALKEFLQQRKHLFSYLQSSIENLQQKSVVWQDTADENIAKQRSLAEKLEANMRDIQAAFEKKQKIEKSKDVESRQQLQPLISQKTSVTQPPHHQLLMAKVSSLQITKAPMIRSFRHEETSQDSTKSEERPTSSLLEQRSKILTRELDTPSGSKLTPHSLQKISSLFPFDISKFSPDTALHELLEYNRTLLPGHKSNLHHAWQLAHQKILQQQAKLGRLFGQ
ncbi:PREDICTED: uncharacterized protein LOC106544183 [Thamnophis sirtalis]|uniref:Uncharacterized protein LOC106544183 n=1 Tax=Thamnophis sirtalis TaxID=35019 RepID=A0A6I9XZ46_9SAUR|nr:PREDICTED: uncharacterized protein LOC106544183 [Thamnophis sirtalis]